jgi:hypothetical protein
MFRLLEVVVICGTVLTVAAFWFSRKERNDSDE